MPGPDRRPRTAWAVPLGGDIVRKSILSAICALTIASLACGSMSRTSAPTDTPIPTPAPLPTRTPGPPTSTPASTSARDLSEAVLTLDDLPDGFEAIDPEEYGFSSEDLSEYGIEVDGSFAFLKEEPLEVVGGFTSELPRTGVKRVLFSVMLNQPELVLALLASRGGAEGDSEPTELEIGDDIGDARTGVTGTFTEPEGTLMRIDLVIFQRDAAGAVVSVVYEDGSVPAVEAGVAARTLDQRIVESPPEG